MTDPLAIRNSAFDIFPIHHFAPHGMSSYQSGEGDIWHKEEKK